MIELLKKTLFSTRLMAVLFLVFATAMAIGTFVESQYSTETARIYIYNATWFEAIMIFFVINFMGNIFRYKLLTFKKWPVLTLHLSWILIIVGAFVTRYISYEGMMPIREGNSENRFYSDKTYLTVFVDGDVGGETRRKVLEDDILVTAEGKRSSLPWKSDFNGQSFKISFVDFMDGAKKDLVMDENGKEYLKIVEAGDGERHEHFLENGQVASIHNVLFALNKETTGAINIYTDGNDYQINSPFEGDFMRMADQLRGTVASDSLQTFQLRSLYNMAGMQFVIPEPLIKGSYGIVKVPEDEITEATQDALVVSITANGQTLEQKLLGGQGTSNFSDKVQVGGLDFSLSYGSKIYELPFSIQLNDFIAEKYPGTEAGYASFMSKITVEDERNFDYDIFMNHVLDHKGYRFFQSSFHPDEKGTVLSVNHDLWGTWITYIGYFLLYIGLMGIMLFGKTRFRDLAKSLQKVQKKKAALTVFTLFISLFSFAQETSQNHIAEPTSAQIDSVIKSTTVSKEHAEKFGALVVQDEGGRMKPLHTFTSELLRKLSGKDKFRGLDSDQVFLSMMLNRVAWYHTEFIVTNLGSKQNDSIREILKVKKGEKYIKATDLFDAAGMYRLKPYLEEATSTTNPNKFQKDFIKLHERFTLLEMALSGQTLKVFPLLNDENNKWISAVEFRSGQYQVQDSLYANFMANALPYYLNTLQNSIATGDYTQADKLLEAFKQNQKNHGSEVLPSNEKIKVEIVYNKLDIFNKLYKYYMMLGVFLFFVLIFRIFKEREIWKAATYFFKGIIVILFIWHTAGLILRWYISGHAPWSDAYESILYVSWATLGLGLLFIRKSDLTLAASTFVASMLLFIAHQSWVDPAIGNLVPVLDSYWLMIHVAVIVGSYGPLTVGMILGVTALLLMILTTKKNKERMEINLKELTIINELALTIGLVMLTIGNFLGGQWANESWGRYWGWDPKETWALISIMIYAFVLHMRFVPALRGRWFYNFMSVAAYGSIMMTYFGVNFYLVGLHSYAQSGSAAITPDYVKYIVLGILVLGAISYWRYRVNYVQSPKSKELKSEPLGEAGMS
ncbi:cytochrome c biogenesis protein CcsA [Flagellimonas sp. HMM57]|uniref:cytochrome c biogenesis protein n=1 Tax=unclassified Flagellimonas TaxID=2644544 RepID=UPI0013D887A6|nr:MULTISPECIES: cytochrome c biogenesis protein CcsA [unclassified Flagellimonas]UII76057.1 cytochrome c biogenesis protein CcsA [Flagellimonas sp. HMM57]